MGRDRAATVQRNGANSGLWQNYELKERERERMREREKRAVLRRRKEKVGIKNKIRKKCTYNNDKNNNNNNSSSSSTVVITAITLTTTAIRFEAPDGTGHQGTVCWGGARRASTYSH